VAARITATIQRNGEELRFDEVHLWRIEDGRLVEMRAIPFEPDVVDEFFARTGCARPATGGRFWGYPAAVGAPELAKTMQAWLAAGQAAAFARVTEVRGVGSAAQGELFAGNEAGETAGDLLGGAVSGPVRAAVAAIVAGDRPAGVETLDLQVADADAARAGLSCGGGVTVVVQATAEIPAQFWSALREQRAVALATAIDPQGTACRSLVTIDGTGCFGSLGDPDLDRSAEAAARALLDAGNSGTRVLEHPGRSVTIEAFVPEPRLVVVGGGTLADAIVSQAAALGWDAVVAADEQQAADAFDWAGATAALVVLSHHADLDAPVLEAAMRRGVGYIGALGSRRTQERRAERLRSVGVAESDIARIHGPIGLDLGGNRPQHVALAICAEILAFRSGRSGASLHDGEGSIRGRHPHPNPG